MPWALYDDHGDVVDGADDEIAAARIVWKAIHSSETMCRIPIYIKGTAARSRRMNSMVGIRGWSCFFWTDPIPSNDIIQLTDVFQYS